MLAFPTISPLAVDEDALPPPPVSLAEVADRLVPWLCLGAKCTFHTIQMLKNLASALAEFYEKEPNMLWKLWI